MSLLLTGAALLVGYTSTQGKEPNLTAWAVAASVFVGLGLALMVALAHLGITACLAMPRGGEGAPGSLSARRPPRPGAPDTRR